MTMRDGLMKSRCSERNIKKINNLSIIVGVRSERTNAGKIRNAAKTKISGSREAERNAG